MSQEYAFDNWVFDADTGEVRQGTYTQRLEPTVARLLEYLLNNQGRLLTRDELIEQVWNNRIVTSEPVNRCISIIRHTFSQHTKCMYIETVPRKGYVANFPEPSTSKRELHLASSAHSHREAKVAEFDEAVNEPGPWDKKTKQRGAVIRTGFLACAVVTFVLLSTWFWVQWIAAPSAAQFSSKPSLLVMPFDEFNTSEYAPEVSEMTDTVIHLLSRIPSVEVAAKTTSLALSEKALTAREIGESLDIQHILEGSVHVKGDEVRVMVRLVDTTTEKQIWSGHFDGTADNIFKLQDDLVASVVGVLTGEIPTQTYKEEKIAELLRVQGKTLNKASRPVVATSTLTETGDLNSVLSILTPNMSLARIKNQELSP